MFELSSTTPASSSPYRASKRTMYVLPSLTSFVPWSGNCGWGIGTVLKEETASLTAGQVVLVARRTSTAPSCFLMIRTVCSPRSRAALSGMMKSTVVVERTRVSLESSCAQASGGRLCIVLS